MSMQVYKVRPPSPPVGSFFLLMPSVFSSQAFCELIDAQPSGRLNAAPQRVRVNPAPGANLAVRIIAMYIFDDIILESKNEKSPGESTEGQMRLLTLVGDDLIKFNYLH